MCPTLAPLYQENRPQLCRVSPVDFYSVRKCISRAGSAPLPGPFWRLPRQELAFLRCCFSMAARFDSPGSHGDASRATCCDPLLVVLCPVSNPGQAYQTHATEIPGLGAQGAKARVKRFCDCSLSKGSLVEKFPMY